MLFRIQVLLLCLLLSRPLMPAATAAATAPLPLLLDRTGKQVQKFWEDLATVSCSETIAQAKLNPSMKVISQKREVYNYLIFLQLSGDQLTVEESRELQGRPGKQPAQPMLVTGGFSVLMLVFHPHFQSSFVFRELPSEQPGERKLAFTAVPGARSPSVVELSGRDYPIEWSGTATLDIASGAIIRIQAELASPMEDIGLMELKADVNYAPVAFKQPAAEIWLTKTAFIEAATRKQRWRNVHEFSAYRRFLVSTDVKIGGPQ